MEQKWRFIKAQYRAYEDNKAQSGAGRKTEPAHYDLLSSFLKHRPLSKPSLLVVEGTSSSQQCVTTVEARALHQYALDLQPQPGTALHSPQAPHPVQPPHSSHEPLPDMPELSQEPRPGQSGEPPQVQGPITTPPPPAKTRTRMRPATEKQEMLEVLKDLRTIMNETLLYTKESNEQTVALLKEMNERDKQRHNVEMQIKEKQLAVLCHKVAQMEVNVPKE